MYFTHLLHDNIIVIFKSLKEIDALIDNLQSHQ